MTEVPTIVHVSPERLREIIDSHRLAAESVHAILSDIRRRGRITVSWTGDEVSRSMAEHYNSQIFHGDYSTYSVLTQYEMELRAVTSSLEAMQSSYGGIETDIAATLRRL